MQDPKLPIHVPRPVLNRRGEPTDMGFPFPPEFEGFFSGGFTVVIIEEAMPCQRPPSPRLSEIFLNRKMIFSSLLMAGGAFLSPLVATLSLLLLSRNPDKHLSNGDRYSHAFENVKNGEACPCQEGFVANSKKVHRARWAALALSALMGIGANQWLNHLNPTDLLANSFSGLISPPTPTAPAQP